MKKTDPEKSEAFGQKMTDILNYGALNLAMGIGYRTGLFDAMASLGMPATVDRVAEKAELSERYVREWLGIMYTGGIVELSRDRDGEALYYLPPEHGAMLAKSGAGPNLGVYTQEIPLLTDCAGEKVIEGFKSGEGVSYDHYPPFQAFMAELANAKHRKMLVSTFIPSVRGGELAKRLEAGIRVCDFGCGEGVAMVAMAEAFPNSRFVGIDIDGDALEVGRASAEKKGLSNVEFLCRDGAGLKEESGLKDAFDYILALDAVHDQTAPMDALCSAWHMLRPGGIFSMVDIAAHTDHEDNKEHPMGPFLYTVSLMHCMPVGLVNGGAGLGMMWGREKAVEMLKQAGFPHVAVEEIPGDPFNLHFCCRKTLSAFS